MTSTAALQVAHCLRCLHHLDCRVHVRKCCLFAASLKRDRSAAVRRTSNAAGVVQHVRLITVSVAAAATSVTTGLHGSEQQISNTIHSYVDGTKVDLHACVMCVHLTLTLMLRDRRDGCVHLPVCIQCRLQTTPSLCQPRSLIVPRYRLSSYRWRAFSVAGPAIWNWLPDSLRDPAISRDSFRRSLKTFLFSAYLCT